MKKSFLPWVTREEGTPGARSVSGDDREVASSGRTHGKSSGNLGGPLRLIINTLAIFLISQVIAGLIAMLMLQIAHPNGHMSLDDSIAAQFIYVLFAEGLAAWLVIQIVRRRRLPLKAIGLGRLPSVKDFGPAIIGFMVFYGLLIVAGILISDLSPEINNQKQNLGFTDIKTQGDTILAFISLVILPPLAEETLVRGYLYSGLRMVWRFVPALVVTSLFFGLAHLEIGGGGPLVWGAAVDTFLLSIVLVYLREKTGALYAGMLVHMLNNLIAFFVVIK